MRCFMGGCNGPRLATSNFCVIHATRLEREKARVALPETTQVGLGPVLKYETPGEEIERLLKENLELKREAGQWKTKYDQLNIIYNKLADQWNAFQALSKPDNRNIQRAEGAGEMARKLGEILLCLAYDTDSRDLIQNLLSELHFRQQPAGGQEVEVSEKLVRSPHRG